MGREDIEVNKLLKEIRYFFSDMTLLGRIE
jgi:hypothetical protein